MANSNSVCVVNVYFSFLFVAVRCFCSRFVVYDCVVHWRLHCWPIYIFFFCSIRSSARCMRTSFLRYSPCTFLFIDFFMHTSSIAPSHGHSHSEIHDTQQQQRRRRLTVLWHLKRNKPNQQFIGCVSKNLFGFVFVLLCYFFFFVLFSLYFCVALIISIRLVQATPSAMTLEHNEPRILSDWSFSHSSLRMAEFYTNSLALCFCWSACCWFIHNAHAKFSVCDKISGKKFL